MISIDIQAVFSKHFGFNPPAEEIRIDGNDSRIVNIKSDDKWYRADPDDLYGRTVFMPVTINGLFLPYCWLSITGGNKIVETDFTERDGTVKEYIAANDLEITLQGVVLNRDGTFPERQIEDLRDLWRVKESVEIDCPLLDIFLLTNETGAQDKVVIYNYRLLENKGVEHVRGFEMMLKSDQEFPLEII